MSEPSPHWVRALRVFHPFPTLMNAVTTGALALVALRGRPAPLAIAHLMLAMLAIQASIGIVNDIADRGLDAVGERAKPLVEGTLSLTAARGTAAVTLIAAAVLSTGFGVAAWLLAMAGLACGLSYDLWLKRTAASGLPYLVALPLLPIWVWVALGRFSPSLLALVPPACLVGLALHLANGLTDFDTDARAGAGGLAQRLGKRRALFACWAAFAAALVLAGGPVVLLHYGPTVLVPGLAVATVALVTAIALYVVRPVQHSLQVGWVLLAVGAAVLAFAWLAALAA